MLVAQHLDLNVARVLHELLDEHAVVAEGGQPLALGRLEPVAHVGLAPGEPHALAAAAGRGLHHHGVADFGRDPHRVLGVVDLADEARHDRHARLPRELLRLDLVAHRRDGVGRRPDEGDARLGARFGEALPLGQEAVARVDGVRPGLLGGSQDAVGAQVALGRRRRPQPHRLVRHAHVRRALIGVGIDRHGGDPHPLGSADDPTGNLAPVRDQDFREHLVRRPRLAHYSLH